MKQKDIALIAVIAIVSGTISFVVSHYLFSGPQNRSQKVAVVDTITTQFITPDSTYFNSQSIDPAKVIAVGNVNNPNPFNGTGR